MTRSRRIAGIVAGSMLALSAFAHSVLGGQALQREMTAANVPSDLLRGALIGWEFGGVAMLAFGILVLLAFLRRPAATSGESRAEAADGLGAVRVVAATYLLFGVGALVYSGFDPFFLVFVVPGLLLAFAAGLGPIAPGRAA